MNCYNVSLYGFFSFFYEFFFPKWSLSILFFSYWAGWEFCFMFFLKKQHCGLLKCFPIWFLFCYSVYPHVFFSKLSLLNFFFNIELVENLALTFPTCFFSLFKFFFLLFFSKIVFFFHFFMFFSELFLLILFF